MREQLIQYVNLLFAGNPDAEEIKQEILQNTLDRYDDLVSQGKSPEAAYSLAISGIGDVSEFLKGSTDASASVEPVRQTAPEAPGTPAWKTLMHAVAVGLYILCVVPVIVLSELGMEVIGVCGMFALIAIATVLIIIAGSGKSAEKEAQPENLTPRQELDKAINSIINIVMVCVYLAVSFATGAWWITWLIFPIVAAVKGVIKACNDLKEESKNEN